MTVIIMINLYSLELYQGLLQHKSLLSGLQLLLAVCSRSLVSSKKYTLDNIMAVINMINKNQIWSTSSNINVVIIMTNKYQIWSHMAQ